MSDIPQTPKSDHVGVWIFLGLAAAGATLFAPTIANAFKNGLPALDPVLDPGSDPSNVRDASPNAPKRPLVQRPLQLNKPPKDDSAQVAAHIARLQAAITDLQTKLTTAQGKPKPNATQIANIQTRIADLQSQIRVLGG